MRYLSPAGERRLLQMVVAILALVPVVTGLASVACGLSIFDPHAAVSRSGDSQVHYLSGLLTAIGLGFWTTVPRIDEQGGRFRLLTALVLAGGFARLYAVVRLGLPAAGMLAGLALELIVTPGLAVWREALERKSHASTPRVPSAVRVPSRQEAGWPI
jgi:hypothetical protein